VTARDAVGSFAGRSVNVRAAWDIDSPLDASVVLVVLCGDVEPSCRTATVEAVFSRDPLAIQLFGVGAAQAFDALIDRQAAARGRSPHVMTSVSETTDLEEAIGDFLGGTFPSEERFDEWTTYQVVVAGDESDFIEVLRAVKEVLEDRPR
jgi:hypothetical protein